MKSRLRRETHLKHSFSRSLIQRGSSNRFEGLTWESPAPQVRMLEGGDSRSVRVLPVSTSSKQPAQISELDAEWFLERVKASFFEEISKKDRLKMAALWYREALFEKAQAEDLGLLSSTLIGAGAPLSLLKTCARAYLDDLEHARLCYSMARAVLGDEVVQFKIRSGDDDGFDDFALEAQDGSSVSVSQSVAPEPCDYFELARKSLFEGVLVQELASRFSIHLSRCREWHPVAAELLKKSMDETRQSDLYWDIFSWSLKKLGKEAAQRLWVLWNHQAKPRFEDALIGDGKMRDLYRDVRDEMSERLQKYFELEWKLLLGENSEIERALPISRPAS